MLNPISIAFQKAKKENRPALLTYTVAGDSSKKQSLKILNAISEYADILELGVPHNTPVADGSQIQTSSYRAIKNGIKVKDIFHIVRNYRRAYGLHTANGILFNAPGASSFLCIDIAISFSGEIITSMGKFSLL